MSTSSSAPAARTGHTAAPGRQLELEWEVPPSTPAESDFLCWLWAAFPQRDGRLNFTRIGDGLGVSRTTVRRWVTTNKPRLTREQKNTLIRRAILRGRGHMLWPPLNPILDRRAELNRDHALQCARLIRDRPQDIPPTWRENDTLEPRRVLLLHFPRAHVYGVASVYHEKAIAKLLRRGEIVEEAKAPNKFAGIVLKQLTLERVDDVRVIVPRELVPTGRTEVWLETAELPRLRKRLPA